MCPKVSVIVPVYNAEKYLNRCVDSIINQSFHDWELLLVDDGSTDNSAAICDEFAMNYDSINVIHKTNGGSVKARKIGLDNTNGDYVIFIDSDDYIAPNMLEILFHGTENGEHDLVCCNYAEVHKTHINKIYNKSYSSNTDYIINIIEGNIGAYLWNKLIKRNLFMKNVKLNEGYDMWEDMQISIQLFFYAKSIRLLNTEPLYFYNCTNYSSISSTKGKKKIEAMVSNLLFIKEFLKVKSIAPAHVLDKRIIYCKLLIISNIIGAEYWRNTFPEMNVYILKTRHTPVKYKFLVFLIICHLDRIYKMCQFCLFHYLWSGK